MPKIARREQLVCNRPIGRNLLAQADSDPTATRLTQCVAYGSNMRDECELEIVRLQDELAEERNQITHLESTILELRDEVRCCLDL